MATRWTGWHPVPVAKDYTTAVEPVLRPVLDPAERLLMAAPVTKDPGTTDDVSVSDELKNLLDPTIVVGLGTHPGNLLQRAAFGRAVVGGPDSLARQLHFAVDAVTAPRVAVTDRRLIVVDVEVTGEPVGNWLRRLTSPAHEVARLVHSVPRADIAGAVIAPVGLLRRGRFLVLFTDGSLCAVACSVARLGRQVAEALGPPTPDAPSGAPGEEKR
jgi:hypothetical protein